jgi:DUF2924 family protein
MTGMTRRSSDREAIEAEIDRVRSLGLDELRTLWRTTLRSSPPSALTKDLVARFICWHIQEQAFGGLDPDTAKLLDSLAQGDKPGADGPRRLKPGTVLVREYQGERHTVTVVPGGYIWREATYASGIFGDERASFRFDRSSSQRATLEVLESEDRSIRHNPIQGAQQNRQRASVRQGPLV